jgi:uroporphyrinogen-III decarboxylase
MEGISNWKELTPDQKRQIRFQRWLDAPGVKFKNKEAEQLYKTRVTRFIKAINLEEGDRVPCSLPVGWFPAYYAGYDLYTVMHDYEKMKKAWFKFMHDFGDMDNYGGVGLVLPAKALEILGHNMHKWPGHGLAKDVPSYQFVEREYMKKDEYDHLIQDPSDFWLRVFMPRQADAFKPLESFMHLNPMIGLPISFVPALSTPEMQQMFKTIWAAGAEMDKWMQAVGEVSTTALAEGYPASSGSGFSGAPFDMLTDFMRGTQGIFMDLFRQPEKIHAAMERLVPIMIEAALNAAGNSLAPILFMPLHKGEKGFMSPKQFEDFYWPTFKKVLLGIIDEGLVPMPFAEGNYIPRLEIIQDMPKGSMVWYFEYMDMKRAKETVGKKNCIYGNLPISIMVTGTAEDVKAGCRKLLEDCAPGGGYILSAAASMDNGKVENLHAMMDTVKEYGKY